MFLICCLVSIFMDNVRRVEIISVTLLLFVAIVTPAGSLLQDVDKGFASFLTLVYGIDIFCVVFLFYCG
jgi:hypothetical protein